MLGFLTGAAIFGLTYRQVFPQIQRLANIGTEVIPDLWNLDPYLFIFMFALMAVFLFYLIDRAGLQRKDKIQS